MRPPAAVVHSLEVSSLDRLRSCRAVTGKAALGTDGAARLYISLIQTWASC